MSDSYDVFLSGEKVGVIAVRKNGLFYGFDCKCTLRKTAIYTVIACCGDRNVNLGVLIPNGDVFCLQKQIPVKKLGEGNWSFSVEEKNKQNTMTFYAVDENKPFRHIDKLVNAYWDCQNGQIGIKVQR